MGKKMDFLLHKQQFTIAIISICNGQSTDNQFFGKTDIKKKLQDIIPLEPNVDVNAFFTSSVVYSGKWKLGNTTTHSLYSDFLEKDTIVSYNSTFLLSSSSNTPFDGQFGNREGSIEIGFGKYSDGKDIIQLHFIDGFYVDHQQVYVRADLTNTYDVENSSFSYKDWLNFTRVNQFNNDIREDRCETTLNILLRDKNTGANWDISQKYHGDLRVQVTFYAPDQPCSFGFTGDSIITGDALLMPLIYLACVALGSQMNIASVYFLVKDTHYYFFYKVDPYSQAVLMILDFQFFGFNMFQGLSIAGNYFEYLTMASIGLFFGCLVKMRLAFMAVQFQNANNENLNQRNCSNPVMNFAIKVLVSMSVFYIASFFIMVNWWYSYYLIAFYFFPILQIWKSARIGTRKVFKWQYQLLLWPQSVIIPIFLKGYNDNFIKLTPNVLVHSIIVPSMIAFFLQQSFLQHIFGPRFCIFSLFFPAPHKYMVLIKNVPRKENEDELVCPICYGELEIDPSSTIRDSFSATENDDPNQNEREKPLIIPDKKSIQKKCMMTPCKHYYHPTCLKQWMDQKMECPTCRSELPPY